MILHIIRHAAPDYEHDTITEYGWREARALGAWMKDKPLDKIYTSPRGRAKDTASPTCEIKGMTPEVLPWTDECMDYMESHVLKPDDQCSYRFSVQTGAYDFVDFKDTERMQTIYRMKQHSDEFLASLGYVREGIFYKVENHNDQHIAVFCHGGFGAEWIAHLLGIGPGLSFPAICLSTTSVNTFEFQNHESGYIRPHLLAYNDVAHIHVARANHTF
ncbi:MAG: histidine phosphatase family protein [Clostridia bacterium]|nr:histidine phosphatase family protein [Clostridia bacterium]